MKCPLFVIARLINKEVALDDMECLKGECAGWDSSDECCCVVDIASSLSMIMFFLREISENGIPNRGGK